MENESITLPTIHWKKLSLLESKLNMILDFILIMELVNLLKVQRLSKTQFKRVSRVHLKLMQMEAEGYPMGRRYSLILCESISWVRPDIKSCVFM